MRDDPIALLERELLDAAHRRAVPVDEPDASSHEPRGPRPHASRPARRRSSLGAFAAVVMAGLALVVMFGALTSPHGHKAPVRSVSARPATAPGRRQLIDILGVLRRPQTPADLRPPWGPRGSWVPPSWGRVDLSLIRRATTTPWGVPVFVIPVKPSPGTSAGAEAVVLDAGSGGGCCATASDVATYGDMTTEGAGRAFAGGSTKTRFTTLVPDGVAAVEFVLPRPVTVAVHDNVAAVQVNQGCCTGGIPMIWKGADGHVIRSVSGAGAAAPRPRPGPETALSRAAERDPSTPNRVWVTPSVGGPNTKFTVHFRVLLNNADYSYRLSGTRCPAITPSGGGGGGTEDLRGRIWSDSIDAVQGQGWCPGTYHLSVAVMGRANASPFGTATFTVKR